MSQSVPISRIGQHRSYFFGAITWVSSIVLSWMKDIVGAANTCIGLIARVAGNARFTGWK